MYSSCISLCTTPWCHVCIILWSVNYNISTHAQNLCSPEDQKTLWTFTYPLKGSTASLMPSPCLRLSPTNISSAPSPFIRGTHTSTFIWSTYTPTLPPPPLPTWPESRASDLTNHRPVHTHLPHWLNGFNMVCHGSQAISICDDKHILLLKNSVADVRYM